MRSISGRGYSPSSRTARIDLGPNGASASFRGLFAFVVVIVAVQCWCGRALGLYRGRYRVGGYDEAIAVAIAWAAVATSTALLELALSPRLRWLAETPALFRASVALTIMAVVRFSWRTVLERELRPGTDGRKRAVVIGAGEAGYLIVRGMLTDPTAKTVPVALLDDSPVKARRTLMGVSVVGTVDDLPRVARETQADLIIIAIPSATSLLIRKVVDLSRDAGLDVRTLPPTSELAGSVSMRDVRPINDNDLLGREEVEVDLDQITAYIRGRRVLVTGAGGSIGSELCRQLARLDPEVLLMLDRDENGLHGVQLSIDGRALLDSPSLIVADIRDRERLLEIFELWRPEVVFHAAALKHLTLLEQHPMEGVKTNVVGTRNVIDAALAAGAERIRQREHRQSSRPVQRSRAHQADGGADHQHQRRPFRHPRRQRAVRQRAEQPGLGGAHLPGPDQGGRTGDGDRPRGDPVLHDHPGGGAPRSPGGGRRRAGGDADPRHG